MIVSQQRSLRVFTVMFADDELFHFQYTVDVRAEKHLHHQSDATLISYFDEYMA